MAGRWPNIFAGWSVLMVISSSFVPSGSAQTASSVDAQAQEEKAVVHATSAQKPAAQNDAAADSNAGQPDYSTRLDPGLFKRFGKDQLGLWTFPRHLSWEDADVVVPFGLATGGFLAADSEFSRHLSNSPTRLNDSDSFSNYGIGAMAGVGGGMYLWGHFSHDDHKKETGFLASESALNAFLIVEAMKYGFGRSRPLDQPKYSGDFWHGGVSMPSEHAAVAWAIAGILSHEYPGPLPSFLAYGLASSISMARITGKQHFPSDVLVGSVVGWYVGKYVYRAHHDPELGGGDWQSYGEFRNHGSTDHNTSLGTTFVPLSSWIYPALKRLVALGYVQSQFMGMEPWSRLECAKMVQEAGERISESANTTDEVNGLYTALLREFASDSERIGGGTAGESSARLESVYTRVTGISGSPLNDSYHFGQTIVDDFGRPYAEGANAIAGGSAWVTQGRFAVYASGEYEYAPSAPAYSSAVNNAIAAIDQNPVQPGTFPSTNQFRLMDTYVTSNQGNWVLSFGKQSLWWSPDYSNAFLMSDNAPPIYMFRASRLAPFEIPGVSNLLGPMKIDVFFGKLSGNNFPGQPLIHGEKFSFKPVPNLEFGFSRTDEMGGAEIPGVQPNRAITPKAIWLSYFSFTNSDLVEPGKPNPGKRMGGFDFTYRIPGLRNWLTVYSDSFTTDNVSPFADLARAAVAPGLYLTHFPKISKLDLRLEAAYTDTPKVHTIALGCVSNCTTAAYGRFNYYDSFYHDLYTNEGYIIGSWVGREGHGYQAWMTYHASARDSIQFGYRHADVASDFVPGGGNINDASVSVNWWVHSGLNFTGMLQYEKWNYPLLAPTPQTNWTTSVGLNFYPLSLSLPRHSVQQN
ncbi:MAG TPA: capsule assembly Wzi family protein [Candidatus Eremiobacteraceae bacterium]|nr:capsule assembly Wzi family protein [Candidatus Eremiobacteraceae bacterium]